MTIVAMEREAIHEFKRMDRPERAQEALDTQRIREEAQKPKAESLVPTEEQRTNIEKLTKAGYTGTEAKAIIGKAPEAGGVTVKNALANAPKLTTDVVAAKIQVGFQTLKNKISKANPFASLNKSESLSEAKLPEKTTAAKSDPFAPLNESKHLGALPSDSLSTLSPKPLGIETKAVEKSAALGTKRQHTSPDNKPLPLTPEEKKTAEEARKAEKTHAIEIENQQKECINNIDTLIKDFDTLKDPMDRMNKVESIKRQVDLLLFESVNSLGKVPAMQEALNNLIDKLPGNDPMRKSILSTKFTLDYETLRLAKGTGKYAEALEEMIKSPEARIIGEEQTEKDIARFRNLREEAKTNPKMSENIPDYNVKIKNLEKQLEDITNIKTTLEKVSPRLFESVMADEPELLSKKLTSFEPKTIFKILRTVEPATLVTILTKLDPTKISPKQLVEIKKALKDAKENLNTKIKDLETKVSNPQTKPSDLDKLKAEYSEALSSNIYLLDKTPMEFRKELF
jgi:hypothetical protein